LKEYRVTKYDPTLRDPEGHFLADDWISFSQIGQTFGGVVLTEQQYRRVENAYISVALAFLNEAGLMAMRVEGLEKNRQQPIAFNEGTVLRVEQLDEIIGRILREEFWCRLQGDNAFVHFGWDYYMYIGVPHPCPVAERKATELGLYVEEFVSPYHGDRIPESTAGLNSRLVL
jgi:hypothetical protein